MQLVKKDPIEDAHFRIDEHERKLDEIGKALSPEVVAAVVQGAIAALKSGLDSKHDELLKAVQDLLTAIRDDAQTDKDVVSELRELVKTLRTPTTRIATMQLPTGPATMTVKESR